MENAEFSPTPFQFIPCSTLEIKQEYIEEDVHSEIHEALKESLDVEEDKTELLPLPEQCIVKVEYCEEEEDILKGKEDVLNTTQETSTESLHNDISEPDVLDPLEYVKVVNCEDEAKQIFTKLEMEDNKIMKKRKRDSYSDRYKRYREKKKLEKRETVHERELARERSRRYYEKKKQKNKSVNKPIDEGKALAKASSKKYREKKRLKLVSDVIGNSEIAEPPREADEKRVSRGKEDEINRPQETSTESLHNVISEPDVVDPLEYVKVVNCEDEAKQNPIPRNMDDSNISGVESTTESDNELGVNDEFNKLLKDKPDERKRKKKWFSNYGAKNKEKAITDMDLNAQAVEKKRKLAEYNRKYYAKRKELAKPDIDPELVVEKKRKRAEYIRNYRAKKKELEKNYVKKLPTFEKKKQKKTEYAIYYYAKKKELEINDTSTELTTIEKKKRKQAEYDRKYRAKKKELEKNYGTKLTTNEETTQIKPEYATIYCATKKELEKNYTGTELTITEEKKRKQAEYDRKYYAKKKEWAKSDIDPDLVMEKKRKRAEYIRNYRAKKKELKKNYSDIEWTPTEEKKRKKAEYARNHCAEEIADVENNLLQSINQSMQYLYSTSAQHLCLE